MARRSLRVGTDERGFALLIVLWSVVLLSGLAATVVLSGRSDVQLALNLRGEAAAEQAADGAVFAAAFHLLDPASPWPTDGSRIEAGRGGVGVGVCVSNESGRINPNTASPGLMAALLRALGVDLAASQRLSAAIYDWRTSNPDPSPGGAKLRQYQAAGLAYGPPGVPFGSVGEVGLVLGMTPQVMARLAPELTVWTDDDPDPTAASPVVRAALRALLGFEPAPSPDRPMPRTVAVSALAQTRDGARFLRRAVLRLGSGANEPPVRVLAWEQGGAPVDCRRAGPALLD